jgi:cupin superfamily acireductone dioxygenase involved in methionine salvage
VFTLTTPTEEHAQDRLLLRAQDFHQRRGFFNRSHVPSSETSPQLFNVITKFQKVHHHSGY